MHPNLLSLLSAPMEDNSINPQKTTILFLAANPKNTSRLRLDEEVRELDEGLQRSQLRSEFILKQRWAVRARDIQQAMLDTNPQIVHFSGHGEGIETDGEGRSTSTDRNLNQNPDGEEGLAFEDVLGQAQLVSGQALGGLFALFAGLVECVVLNGCYSATQGKTIAQHIPCVVGMRKAIGDGAAIAFTRGFYNALMAGRSIQDAYQFGCNEIQLMNIPEHLTPVLIWKGRVIDPQPKPSEPQPEFPSGPVPLNSLFYVERFLNEPRHYQAIESSGCLLRIIAPSLMGKTSLMARILNYAEQQHHTKVYVNLRDAEQNVFSDLDKFLYWFCDRISSQLKIGNLSNYRWNDETSGCITKCSDYLERQILSQIRSPLVLSIDEIDRVFSYNKVASDFVGMLRSWFEKGRNDPLWQRLRMVLAYSLEDYSQFNIHQSPFNVGQPLRLRELTQPQVEDLANQYQLNWQEQDVQRLMSMVGGNPFLVRLALYYISTQEMTLEDLLKEAPTEDSIYIDHLRRCWQKLNQQPRLTKLVSKIMASEEPITVDRSVGHQLHSIGLIKYVPAGTHVVPSCNLYRLYFNR